MLVLQSGYQLGEWNFEAIVAKIRRAVDLQHDQLAAGVAYLGLQLVDARDYQDHR